MHFFTGIAINSETTSKDTIVSSSSMVKSAISSENCLEFLTEKLLWYCSGESKSARYLKVL